MSFSENIKYKKKQLDFEIGFVLKHLNKFVIKFVYVLQLLKVFKVNF